MLQYYLENSTLRVVSKTLVSTDRKFRKFYLTVSINNGEKKMYTQVNLIKTYYFERSTPENLKKGQVSITHAVLQDIFIIIEDSDRSERPFSLSNICDYLNLLCGRDVGNLVKKSCNFLKVRSRLIRNILCV